MTLRGLTLLAAMSTQAALVDAAVRTVALTGAAAPGAPAGAEFLSFTVPTLNGSGRTAFEAVLETGAGGVAAAEDSGIWSEGSGVLALVAREGSQAPGAAVGAKFNDMLGEPVLNSAGQTASYAQIFGTGVGISSVNNEGLWSQSGGTLGLAVREGTAAPGTSAGVNFSGIFPPGMNGANQISFRARLTGTGVMADVNDIGIWNVEGGVANLVARAGNPAPGAGAGVNIKSFSAPTPPINSSGRTAFRGFLAGTGVDAGNDSGVWVERGADVALVAREGSQALGAGVLFDFIGDPVLNSRGDVSFLGSLKGAGVNASNNDAIWAEDNGVLGLVARAGSPAAGFGAGVNYATFASPMLNSQGQSAFLGAVTGGSVTALNDGAMWSERTGSLALVAREGDAAPGTPAGVSLGVFSDPVLNNAGQMAFTSTLTGLDVTAVNDRAIFAQTLAGTLQLVAREGDQLEVSPGVMRTISTLSFVGGFGNDDGRRSGFNNRGEVAFLANFTDASSGVFVSDVAKFAAADFDSDGDVDGDDFLTWQRGLGATGTGTLATGDANNDTNVNAADLDLWKGSYGLTPVSTVAAVVPEPSTSCLIAFAATAFGYRAGAWRRGSRR